MNRREFVKNLGRCIVGFALLSLVGLNSCSAAQVRRTSSTSEKPNIVLLMMDNLGWGEVGCYGGGILRGAETPRIDKLASG